MLATSNSERTPRTSSCRAASALRCHLLRGGFRWKLTSRFNNLRLLATGDPIALDVEGWMRAYRVPGISVAVFDGFRVVWAKAYGVREAGKPEPGVEWTR